MTDFEKKILATITKRNLLPRPAYVFLARRSVFWTLAVAAIAFGGLSNAILLFVVSDYFASGWRVLDNIRFNDYLYVLPLLWLVVLGLFTVSAALALRRTRRGFRLSAPSLATLALGASLLAGGFLHGFDVGGNLHRRLAGWSPAYRAFTHVPFEEWSRPAEGFLGGTVVAAGEGWITLLDFHNRTWTVDVSGAAVLLDESALAEGDIAIIGKQTGPAAFRADRISEFD